RRRVVATAASTGPMPVQSVSAPATSSSSRSVAATTSTPQTLLRGRGASYRAGPFASVIVALCWVPNWSTQASFTRAPGSFVVSAESTSSEDETVLPATAVITSPAASPTLPAGEPGTTAATYPPVTLSPNPNPPFEICTPMKGVPPTWIVDVELPDSICFTILRAALIGIAYASVDAVDWK